MDNIKRTRAVVHLELDGRHYYYGNLKALCNFWGRDVIGVAYNYLKNYRIDVDNPFIGKRCIIRKGFIVTSPRNKKNQSI